MGIFLKKRNKKGKKKKKKEESKNHKRGDKPEMVFSLWI